MKYIAYAGALVIIAYGMFATAIIVTARSADAGHFWE